MDRDLERCRCVAEAFEHSQRTLWSSIWPSGHCSVTSLLLAPLLRCADPSGKWRIAIGVVAYALPRRVWRYKTEGQPLRHAWCERLDGAVVDATYGQFDMCDPLVVLEPVCAGDLGHYAHVILDLDAEEAYRRSIQPTLRSGWGMMAGRTDMIELFERLDYL